MRFQLKCILINYCLDTIYGLLLLCQSISFVCGEDQMKKSLKVLKEEERQVLKEMNENEEYRESINAARRQGAEIMLDDVDDMYREHLDPESDVTYDTNALRDYSNHARWLAARRCPNVYGDQKIRAGVSVGHGDTQVVVGFDWINLPSEESS